MRDKSVSAGMILIPALLAGVVVFSGCGDFWQAPGSTGSSGGTATTTTLTASTTTPTEGASVTLTATVSPSAATGTVTFYNDSTSIGTGTLSDGTATLSTTFTTAGAQSLTATYGGSSTYASSTSSTVAVTVSAASSSVRKQLAAADSIHTTAYGSSPVHAIRALSAADGSYTAENAEAVVVEGGGSVTLNGTELSSSDGAGRGILLSNSSPDAATQDFARFTMTGGSITYNCAAGASNTMCSSGGQNDPAAVFSVPNAKAGISLTDVAVTNNTATSDNREGTLLTAGKPDASGTVTFLARGAALTGNVMVGATSTVLLSLSQDDTGTGSSLTGAINSEDAGKAVSLTLDKGSAWSVTGTSYLTTLNGLDLSGTTVNNIDGGGHCVYYSGSINGSNRTVTYALSGGGFLAPAGTTGLACD